MRSLAPRRCLGDEHRQLADLEGRLGTFVPEALVGHQQAKRQLAGLELGLLGDRQPPARRRQREEPRLGPARVFVGGDGVGEVGMAEVLPDVHELPVSRRQVGVGGTDLRRRFPGVAPGPGLQAREEPRQQVEPRLRLPAETAYDLELSSLRSRTVISLLCATSGAPCRAGSACRFTRSVAESSGAA